MKTLRHPLLSLAAVFLALAVGVVLGARVLPGLGGAGVVGADADARQQYAALRDENTALNEKLAAAGQFDAALASRTVRDALAGKSVVVDLKLAELEPFMEQLRPEGLFLFLPVGDDEQEAVMRRVEKW